MASIKQRLSDARHRSPLLDHAIRTVEHYGSVNGSQQAAGVTYFGFLSVFPVLLLAFFVVGYIARVDPSAHQTLINAITQVLPGLIGNGSHQIRLADIENAAGAVGLIGLAGILYAGLGWLSALRTALTTLFQEPKRMQPNFLFGKLRDLTGLVVLGAVLLVGVAVSGIVAHTSGKLLDALGLGSGLGWLVTVLAIALGVAAGTLMFFLMFVLLARPQMPQRSLWQGALLAAIGFEALKQLSTVLLASTAGQPAFQAFGIALILLVWINYFSQVTLYAAAWAYTAPAARAAREARPTPVHDPSLDATFPAAPRMPEAPRVDVAQVAQARRPGWAVPFASGASAMLAVVALTKRKQRHP
jgi:membrane protein